MVITLTTIVVATFLNFVAGAPWFRFPLTAVLAYGIAMTIIILVSNIASMPLPDWYMRAKPFESEGRFYLPFGILTFRNLLLVTRIDTCNRLVRFSGHRKGLQSLEQGVRQAETVHVISFLVLLLVLIYAATNAWIEVVVWLALVNVVANVYPVMLQRHNRARINAVLERAP